MYNRYFILFIILIACFSRSFSQKIQFKNDKVLIDERPVFFFEKINHGDELHLTSIHDQSEIIIQYHNNESYGNFDDDYIHISFETWNTSLHSKSHVGTWKYILRWMHNAGLINTNGRLLEHQVTEFCRRFDENISSTTLDDEIKMVNKF
jgi:hypothetical protein